MPEQQKYQQKQVNILFLAANPKNSSLLRLDEEIRSVDQFLRASDFRDRFTLNQQWAVRMTDLQGYLLRYKPDIVHFSGHGSDSQGIILEDGFGNSHPVSGRALSSLFSVLKDNVRCVVMNACYSDKQAQEIAKYIDCVIGMSEAIGDKAAINFAAAFYQALGYGRDIKTAFDLGCIQIDIANLSQQDIPKLLSLKNTASEIVFTEGKIS
ncbi:CHAT domain-containing protein [Nodularia sp. LEGE 04288]|nr:CHAT domain-containing protein [Nodularia sp. LEGE 04288]